MSKLNLSITTPEALISNSQVDMVVIPGQNGDFGVLANHAPVISTIRPGAIEVYEGNAIVAKYFISGGFVEINEAGCNVLATKIENLANLTREVVETRIKNLEKTLRHPENDFEKTIAEEDLENTKTLLEVISAK
jgi:F-type H+-transporting ATPase subunit epsilon